jgi:hypothetical protein
LTPANDNPRPFAIATTAPTRAGLHDMIVTLKRQIEPSSAPQGWIVRHGLVNSDGLPTATMLRRPRGRQ